MKNESRYTPIGYDREKMLKYFSNKLAEIDEEYKNFPVINSKYINFAMEKIIWKSKGFSYCKKVQSSYIL